MRKTNGRQIINSSDDPAPPGRWDHQGSHVVDGGTAKQSVGRYRIEAIRQWRRDSDWKAHLADISSFYREQGPQPGGGFTPHRNCAQAERELVRDRILQKSPDEPADTNPYARPAREKGGDIDRDGLKQCFSSLFCSS